MAVAKGMLLTEPTYDVIAPATNLSVPFATLTFWLSRTSGGLQLPATVYQDGNLQIPYPSNIVTAGSNGSLPPIYINPSVPLRVQTKAPSGQLLGDVDPYVLNSRFVSTALVTYSELRTSTTTLAPSTYLTIAVPYAGTYRYELQAEFVCSAGSGTNPGLSFGMFLKGNGASTSQFNVLALNGGLLQDVAPPVQIPGGVITAFAADAIADPGSGAVYGQSAYSSGTTGYPITLSTSVHSPVRITGMFTCTGPCSITFAWAQNTSTSNSLLMLAGSYLKVQNIQSTAQAGVSIAQPLGALDYSGVMTIGSALQSPFTNTIYGFATSGFAFTVGYLGGIGTITPAADILGAPVVGLVANVLAGPQFNYLIFALQGTFAQNYMASITTGGRTYPTVSASNFLAAGGYTYWQWFAPAFPAPSWVNGTAGAQVTITLP